MENAVERRRQADNANQESMRNQLHNVCTAFAGLQSEVSTRFDAIESRVAELEQWRESLAPDSPPG